MQEHFALEGKMFLRGIVRILVDFDHFVGADKMVWLAGEYA